MKESPLTENLHPPPLTPFLEGVLDRRTFLAGASAMLLNPMHAEIQAPRLPLPPARPLPSRAYLMEQLGHSAEIHAVVFSPGGQFVLTGSNDQTVRLWETETGKEIRRFEGHSKWVTSVRFSPDSRLVLTASFDSTVRLWNTATGREIRRFTGHKQPIFAAVFSADGRSVLTGSWDQTARLWETETGKEIRRFEGHTSTVDAVAFSPDGRFVLTGSNDQTVRLWETATGAEIRQFLGHTSTVKSVDFSAEGRWILTSSQDRTARIWETETGTEIRQFTGHTEFVGTAVFSPDGRFVLTSSGDKTARLWESATGKEVRQFTGHSEFVESAAFSPDGDSVLTAGDDRTVRLWETETAKEIRQFTGRSENVVSALFSRNGRFLLTGSWDKTARLWETATGKEILRFTGHRDLVTSAVFSRDGRFVLTGSADQTARLWETATGKEIRRFERQTELVNSVAFSPDGRSILTANDDQTARLYQLATGKEIRRFTGHTDIVSSAVFSPDGSSLLTGSWDKTARLWNVATGKEIRRLRGHADTVTSVIFSAEGRSVLTGSDDGTARLWETATGREVRRFAGHHGTVKSVVFSADGRLILTGSGDGTARLWETATARVIRTFTGHGNALTSAAFSPDGRFVLTGSWDKTARLWETVTGKELCRLISFNDGTWAAADTSGRYDASHGGDVEGLHWVVANESVALNQLKADYYEPGLLSKILGVNKEPLRKVRSLAEIEIALPPVSTIVQNGSIAAITLTDRGGGIGPTDVFVNDTLVYTHPPNKTPAGSITFTLDLSQTRYQGRLLPQSAGVRNRLQVVGHTFDVSARPEKPDYLAGRAELVQLSAPRASSSAVSPRIFLLVVGCSRYVGNKLALRFAAKDAIDFSREVTAAAIGWLGKEHVISTLLASDTEHPELKSASRANILTALDTIANDARSTDILLLYLAGHGVAAGSGDRDYYYVTADADDATPGTALFPTVTLSGRQLSDSLTKINAAKKAVILDTCASGEFGKREGGSDIRRSWEDMKDRTGTYVLAGCAADAVSYESSRYNQGLLTYCLLEAMKANDGVWVTDPKAGGPYLDIQKWLQAAESGVPRLVEEAQILGVQRPEFKSGRDARDFYVGRLTPVERQAIRLTKPLPILLPTQNVRDEASPQDEDTLDLRTRINALLLSKSSRGRGQGYALWKTDAQPGAYRFNVRYQNGLEVKATVSLLRFPKAPQAKAVPVTTFVVSASAATLPDKLLAELVQRVEASEAGRTVE